MLASCQRGSNRRPSRTGLETDGDVTVPLHLCTVIVSLSLHNIKNDCTTIKTIPLTMFIVYFVSFMANQLHSKCLCSEVEREFL